MKWRYVFYFPFALGLVAVPEMMIIRRILERGNCIRSYPADLLWTYGVCAVGLIVWCRIFPEELSRRTWAMMLMIIPFGIAMSWGG